MVRITQFDPQIKHRRSIRLKEYDYSLEGAYFVTISTYQRQCIFGDVVNGCMILNIRGHIAFEQWTRLEKRFHPSDFSNFIIMPNHIHGIVHIVRGAGEESQMSHAQIPPLRPYCNLTVTSNSLGAVVRAYKAAVTYRINRMRGFTNPPVWQRNYYEHIVRDETDYESIWNYIETNPSRWNDDQFNPQSITI